MAPSAEERDSRIISTGARAGRKGAQRKRLTGAASSSRFGAQDWDEGGRLSVGASPAGCGARRQHTATGSARARSTSRERFFGAKELSPSLIFHELDSGSIDGRIALELGRPDRGSTVLSPSKSNLDGDDAEHTHRERLRTEAPPAPHKPTFHEVVLREVVLEKCSPLLRLAAPSVALAVRARLEYLFFQSTSQHPRCIAAPSPPCSSAPSPWRPPPICSARRSPSPAATRSPSTSAGASRPILTARRTAVMRTGIVEQNASKLVLLLGIAEILLTSHFAT